MTWFKESLQQHPELAIFLTLAIGFFVGRLRYKSLTLGSVTGTLLAGVLVGQLHIEIPDLVKTVAFIAFLFALGYQVGPQFFAGLRKGGAKQLILALISCVIGLAGAYAVAKALGFGPGWGAGLLAGGLT
ncbi:MAG TPA: aspartate-alanine antiporter, partial [Actinomycetota bacterium]